MSAQLSPAAPSTPVPPIAAAVATFGVPSFTKIDQDNQPLPADAPSWAAVRVTLGECAFDVLVGNVGDRRMNFAEAGEACSKITALGTAGWRLQTLQELEALRDLSRAGPAVDPLYFPDIKPNFYWAGTTYASSPSVYAWLVDFGSGLAGCLDQGGAAFVRAVRSVARASQ